MSSERFNKGVSPFFNIIDKNLTQMKTIAKALGPGLLMAGAAIGVSHLVQATRAGANYGFSLFFLILIVNIFKYPFFEFGHRYAASTGRNLLEGYKEIHSVCLYLFLFLNVFISVISIAGVTYVTAALATILLPAHLDVLEISVIIVISCSSLIFIGHYQALDRLMKFLMVILSLSTITALILALKGGFAQPHTFFSLSPYTIASFPFIAALIGWMPAPIEVSVWQSLWIQAKAGHLKKTTSLKSALFDFNCGYFLAIIMALMFLSLGALMMHNTGESFSNHPDVFASQLVAMFTDALGTWATPIVATAALFAMISTSLTVIDAYPRSLSAGFVIAFKGLRKKERITRLFFLATSVFLSMLIIYNYMAHFKELIDLVTTISFLSSPVFATLNYKLLTSKQTPPYARPTASLRFFSILGLVFLYAFALFYLAMSIWFF